MHNFIHNIARRDAVIEKFNVAQKVEKYTRNKKLSFSLGIPDRNGQTSVSIDNHGVVRFYDAVDGAFGAGGLVHEETESPEMIEWLQDQAARAQ
ncbi:hypothetical protein FBT96_00610 [Rhodobacter capsulatus]|uniref:Uncharacterized protein n=2 Tax=Rhodobacter capsulatus TaxID=1061 RepID=A0A4U1K596_RHOCA|nr:hypothetical protein FBT96_00610 [Rhodobacter capsulatus]